MGGWGVQSLPAAEVSPKQMGPQSDFLYAVADIKTGHMDAGPHRDGDTEAGISANSKHWFTTSFLQPLPYLVMP